MEDLFGVLSELNLLGKVEAEIEAGSYELREDGKIFVRARRPATRPWHLVKGDPRRDCMRWNHVYGKYYRIVPKGCRACWKVVFKARDLAELFRLLEVMKALGLPGKCGVDRRWAYGNFGQCLGFWYGDLDKGLRGGRELFRRVKGELSEALKRDDLDLMLKRGCTELEAILPSDQWDQYGREFDRIEQRLDTLFVVDRYPDKELEVSLMQTHQHWIYWRAQLGDKSYKAFTGGKALWRQPVRYEESAHLDEHFPGLNGVRLEVAK